MQQRKLFYIEWGVRGNTRGDSVLEKISITVWWNQEIIKISSRQSDRDSSWGLSEYTLHILVVCCCCLFSWRYNPLWLYFHSPVAGFSLLVFEVSWSHTTTRHSRLGLLWTSDHSVAETSTWQHTTLTGDKRPCSRWIFFFLVKHDFISSNCRYNVFNWVNSNPQSQQASGRRPTP
jgi:hypothetical protein